MNSCQSLKAPEVHVRNCTGTRGEYCKEWLTVVKSFFGISKDLHHAGSLFMGQNDTGMSRLRIA